MHHSTRRRAHSLASSASLLTLSCLLLAAGNAVAQDAAEPGTQIAYERGPLTGAMGDDLAQIEIDDNYLFFGAEATAQLMQMMQNPISGAEVGTVMPADESGWFIVFEYSDTGYVPDDEKDDLDADAIFESIREGTERSNEERRDRGWAEYHVVRWTEEPHYDDRTNNLSWTIEGESQGSRNLNRTIKLLGRRGVMTATLVSGPSEMTLATAATNDLLDRFEYVPGNTYAEYVPGSDKLAEYGLTALVVGGAGAVLIKSGLLAKFWKPIAAVLVALGAGIKRFFMGGRSSDHDSEKPIA